MNHHALWTALYDQADYWSKAPVVEAVSSALPSNAGQRRSGIPGFIQELTASYGMMMHRPMTFGSIVPALMSNKAMLGEPPPEDELSAWLSDVKVVERAHRETVAWFRAQLPDYPLILAPQLVAGTPLTTTEFTQKLVWPIGDRGRELQFTGAPNVGPHLNATGTLAERIGASARAVALELKATEEWRAFEEAAGSLTEVDKAALRKARAQLKSLLTSRQIDEYEPNLAFPRDQYRRQATEEACNSLKGLARSYTDTFEAVASLIEFAASDVFGQLVFYGKPVTVNGSKLDILGGSPQTVSFEVSDQELDAVNCGNLVWLNDSLVTDACRVEGITININAAGNGTVSVHAKPIEGTRAAWA